MCNSLSSARGSNKWLALRQRPPEQEEDCISHQTTFPLPHPRTSWIPHWVVRNCAQSQQLPELPNTRLTSRDSIPNIRIMCLCYISPTQSYPCYIRYVIAVMLDWIRLRYSLPCAPNWTIVRRALTIFRDLEFWYKTSRRGGILLFYPNFSSSSFFLNLLSTDMGNFRYFKQKFT